VLIRIISGVIAIPFLLAFIILGDYYLLAASAVVSILIQYELYKCLSKKILPVHILGFLYTIIYHVTISGNTRFDIINSNLMEVNALFMISTLIFLVIFNKSVNIVDCAVTVFGFYYVSVMLSYVYIVRMFDSGGWLLVWLIFLCSFGSDSCAYFTGRFLGKHKLSILSEKKTIEGAIGGIIGTGVLCALFVLIMGQAFSSLFEADDLQVMTSAIIIGMVGSVFAQLGDLAASAIKRFAGVKDFGSIMPGHGGLLDRFDSVLFTAPCVFFMIQLIIRLRGSL
jgi:phosphatidate cytidylyltransferase